MNIITEQDLKDVFVERINQICELDYENVEFAAAVYEVNQFYHKLLDKLKIN